MLVDTEQTPPTARVVSGIGRYGRTPARLLTAKLPDRAKVLYALLDDYAGKDGVAFPGRKRLAKDLTCSVDSIDRAIRSLEESGWLVVTRRWDEETRQHRPSLYYLAAGPDDASTRTDAGARTDAARGWPQSCGEGSRKHAARVAADVRPEAVPIKPVEKEPVPINTGDERPPAQSESIVTSRSTTRKPASVKDSLAKNITDEWWERHKQDTAQSWLAIRGVVRTAVGNGVSDSRVRNGLEVLAREGRAVSGGSLQVAMQASQVSNGSSSWAARGDAIMRREEEWAARQTAAMLGQPVPGDYIDGEIVYEEG